MPGGLAATAIRSIVVFALAAVGAALFGVSARGQSAVDGAVAGRVVSAEGDPIEGAEILLEGEQGERRKAVSGHKGEFLMIRLTPGAYRLMARASGYRGQVELAAVVELGRTTELEVGHAVVPRSAALHRRRSSGVRLAPLQSASGRRRLAVVDAQESFLRRDPDAQVTAVRDLEALPVAGRTGRHCHRNAGSAGRSRCGWAKPDVSTRVAGDGEQQRHRRDEP